MSRRSADAVPSPWLRAAVVSTAALFAAVPPAVALINPNYTVVDLVDDSSVVLVLRAAAPADGRITAEVVEALLGKAPTAKTLVFDLSDLDEELAARLGGAFGGTASAPAVVCIREGDEEEGPTGALEIGTTWVGLTEGQAANTWTVGPDPNALETVWGGSARRLIPAIRYTLNDPAAEFPVASEMTWGKNVSLGQLPGKAHGCVLTTDGVVVLCDGGDRVYRPGKDGAPPRDVTDELALTSRSRAMAAGDFNGDGRIDLASWDGAHLRLVLRKADGTFAPLTRGHALSECLSLGTLGGMLVVGVGDGVVLLTPGADGAFTARRLRGAGGPCTVADFNDDGAPDIMQVNAAGLTFYAGRPGSGAFAAPVRSAVTTVASPAALVCGDYDTDGGLDMVVAGDGGAVLLSRDDDRWTNIMPQTGELAEAVGLDRTVGRLIAACPSDVNGDGRQAVALFGADAAPGLFFNRGFACFGIARSLMFSQARGPAVEALGAGQSAGTFHDVNGDLTADLFAVDPGQALWAIFGEADRPRRMTLTVGAGATGPLTITVALGKRALGTRVVRPGEPALIHLPRAGKVTLRWKARDGAAARRDVIVAGPTRIDL
jgi:hypothetical protein